MAWNINYLSRKEEWGHREETLDRTGQTPKPCSSMSEVTGLDSPTLPALLPEAHDFLLGCLLSPWAALLGISWLWNLQHVSLQCNLGSPSITQGPFYLLGAFMQGTLLPHAASVDGSLKPQKRNL